MVQEETDMKIIMKSLGGDTLPVQIDVIEWLSESIKRIPPETSANIKNCDELLAEAEKQMWIMVDDLKNAILKSLDDAAWKGGN
jgi:hypothetical protein